MLVGQVFSPSDEVSMVKPCLSAFSPVSIQRLVSIFNFATFETHTKSTEFEFIYAGSQKMEKDMLAYKWKNQLILYKKVESVPQVV